MKPVENNQVVEEYQLRMLGKDIGHEGIKALILVSNGYLFTSVLNVGEYQQVVLDDTVYEYQLPSGLLEALLEKGLVKEAEGSSSIRLQYGITEKGQELLNAFSVPNYKVLATELKRRGFKVELATKKTLEMIKESFRNRKPFIIE